MQLYHQFHQDSTGETVINFAMVGWELPQFNWCLMFGPWLSLAETLKILWSLGELPGGTGLILWITRKGHKIYDNGQSTHLSSIVDLVEVVHKNSV